MLQLNILKLIKLKPKADTNLICVSFYFFISYPLKDYKFEFFAILWYNIYVAH